VGLDEHVLGCREVREEARLGEPATPSQIRLDYVHESFVDETLELKAAEVGLARSERYVGVALDLAVP